MRLTDLAVFMRKTAEHSDHTEAEKQTDAGDGLKVRRKERDAGMCQRERGRERERESQRKHLN